MKKMIALLLIAALLLSGCAIKTEDQAITMTQSELAAPDQYIPSDAPIQHQLQTDTPSNNEEASISEDSSEDNEIPLEKQEAEAEKEPPAEEEQEKGQKVQREEKEENESAECLTCIVETVDREFILAAHNTDDYHAGVNRAYSWCHPSTTISDYVYIAFKFTNTSDAPVCFNDLFITKVHQRGTEELLPTARFPDINLGGTYMIQPSDTHVFSIEYNLLYPDEPIEIFIQLKDSAPMTE